MADNLVSAARMEEFRDLLAGAGFIRPGIMVSLSVWAQFLAGVAFIMGLAIR